MPQENIQTPVASGYPNVTTTITSTANITGAVTISATANVTGAVTVSATAVVAGTVSLTDISNAHYETFAASASAQILGSTGATGDYIGRIVIVPTSVSPGTVSIQDGAGSAIPVFAGTASSVNELRPIVINLGMKATGAGWRLTAGGNLTGIAIGKFT